MSRLLVVGSVAFDDLSLPTGDFVDVWGGSASYASLAASLFCPVELVAVIGTDFPEANLALLRQHGVDTRGVERAAGRSFRWAGRYDKTLGSRTTLDTQLNVFADFKPKIPALSQKTPFVLLGNIHPALQYEVLEQLDRPRLVVADTMNFWISGEREALVRLLGKVDVLIINDEETRELGQHHNVSVAANAIRAMGPKTLVVKRGEHGALLFGENGGKPTTFFAPAYPLEEVLDPTGAGDSFAGGFLGYLAFHDGHRGRLDEAAFRRAILMGSAIASFCVEDVGPKRLLTLTGDAVRVRLGEFAQLMHVEHDLEILSKLTR